MAVQQHDAWQATLAGLARGRVAILCVGNELYGDDGAGPALAARLRVGAPWQVFNGGVAPENWTGPVCAFRPDVVLVVDALHFDQPGGTIGCWPPQDLASTGMTTHGPSLALLVDVLGQRTGARILIVGIQPACAGLGLGLSQAVTLAVDELAGELERLWRRVEGSEGEPR